MILSGEDTRGEVPMFCAHSCYVREVCSWMDHECWTTGREVRKVGLRAGRFVELDHERIGSWKQWNPLSQVKCVLILYRPG